jgi:hypothetical protein
MKRIAPSPDIRAKAQARSKSRALRWTGAASCLLGISCGGGSTTSSTDDSDVDARSARDAMSQRQNDSCVVDSGLSDSPTSVDSAPSSDSSVPPSDAPVDACSVTKASYTYHGVSIYPANDWFTTDLTKPGCNGIPTTVDPHSASILGYLESVYGDIIWYTGGGASETVNIASKSTPRYAVTGCNYGCDDDPWKDDPSPFKIPVTSPFYQEGSSTKADCSGDCHVIVLNVDDQLTYETYTSGSVSWNGSSYRAESAVVHNLNHPYGEQMNLTGATAGQTPLLGTTDWGEEASLSVIPHILGFQMPVAAQAIKGHVPPASGTTACTSDCSYTLPLGARLRLKASFGCPPATTYPQANLVCVQLKTYGMIFDDTNADDCMPKGTGPGYCSYGLRFGNRTDGTSPWSGDGCCGDVPSGDLDQLFMPAGKYYLHINDFEIMTLGTIEP